MNDEQRLRGHVVVKLFFKHKVAYKYGHLFRVLDLSITMDRPCFEAAILVTRTTFGDLHSLEVSGKVIRKFLPSDDQDDSTSEEEMYLSDSFKILASRMSLAVFRDFHAPEMAAQIPSFTCLLRLILSATKDLSLVEKSGKVFSALISLPCLFYLGLISQTGDVVVDKHWTNQEQLWPALRSFHIKSNTLQPSSLQLIQTLAHPLNRLSLALPKSSLKLVEFESDITYSQLKSFVFVGSTTTFMSAINRLRGARLKEIECVLYDLCGEFVQFPEDVFLTFAPSLRTFSCHRPNILFVVPSSIHFAIARVEEEQTEEARVTSWIVGCDRVSYGEYNTPTQAAGIDVLRVASNEAERCWVQKDDQGWASLVKVLRGLRSLQLLRRD